MSVQRIQQWVTYQQSLSDLKLTEAEKPTPKSGEVLVKINSVSLNYRDSEVCSGTYSHHKGIDASDALVPCTDMAGTVEYSTSADWKQGDQVLSTFNQSHLTGQIKAQDMASGLGLPLSGVLTEYRCFPTTGLVAAPHGLSSEEACTLPIASVTAWMAINGFRPLGQPARDIGGRQTVLLQGTGGVSIAGLQIAKAAGLQTIFTSSSDEKLRRAKEMGANHGINYRKNEDWENEVMRLTHGNGADIIFETGGAETLRKSLDCIAFGGLVNCIGYLSGKEETKGSQLHLNVLALRRNVTIKGIINGPRDRFEEMNRFYEEFGIKPVVDKVYEFEQVREAFDFLVKGGHFGKIVIKVQ